MLDTPPGYQTLTEQTLTDFLAEDESNAKLLGGKPSDWKINEVGDGNLNLVFIVRGPSGGLVVKQSLPYLRLVGESWPLPLNRAFFEAEALAAQWKHAPNLVPQVFKYYPKLYCIIMELLEPHIIMRKGMIDGIEYPQFAEAITEFMAATLFETSDLAQDTHTKRAGVKMFSGNDTLCKITEDVIFTEPYMEHPNNRWTAPYLDDYAKRWRDDKDLAVGISRLKQKFLTCTEALLHADLHTGSIMITKTDTRVIDPEFAFYGPIGFDVGKLIANLIISYFSQAGHEQQPGERDQYRRWICDTIIQVWNGFRTKFLERWRNVQSVNAYPNALFEGPAGEAALEAERIAYMDALFTDSLGFCGASLTRRILGIAHNIDLENIADERQRANCEARALEVSRLLLTNTSGCTSIDDVVALLERQHATKDCV